MRRFEFGTDDLLRSRFALSPAFELCNLLRFLEGRTRQRLPAAWSARLMPVFQQLRRDTDIDAALALHTRTFGANFVALPPRGLAQTWDDDLAAIRATSLSQAHEEAELCLAARPSRDPRVLATLRGDAVVERVADALDQAWHGLLARDWPQLRAICERDVVHRVGQLGRSGWAAALDGFHPDMRWRDGGIDILRTSSSPASVTTLAGRGCCSSRRSSSGPTWPPTSTTPGRRPSSTPPGARPRCGRHPTPSNRTPSPDSSAARAPGCCPPWTSPQAPHNSPRPCASPPARSATT